MLEVGSVLEGKVTGITGFGAFVALPDGKSGMVHISEVADTYVKDIRDYLVEGQTVTVKVMRVTDDGKINLSIRRAATPATGGDAPAGRREDFGSFNRPKRAPRVRSAEPTVAGRTNDASFEDKLKHFMQESDSKMSGNKLYENQRKGSRRRR